MKQSHDYVDSVLYADHSVTLEANEVYTNDGCECVMIISE